MCVCVFMRRVDSNGSDECRSAVQCSVECVCVCVVRRGVTREEKREEERKKYFFGHKHWANKITAPGFRLRGRVTMST